MNLHTDSVLYGTGTKTLPVGGNCLRSAGPRADCALRLNPLEFLSLGLHSRGPQVGHHGPHGLLSAASHA